MRCPYCNNELKIPPRAETNMRSYGHSVYVKTLCCGAIVLLEPVATYKVTYTNREEDDWGEKRS